MKILVAMSGGVDSSVAAYLLKREGHDITGCTLLLSENTCGEAEDVCKHMDIPHIVLDWQKEFQRDVVDYFLTSYQNGETPNPCVVCNEKLKIGKLLEYCVQNGFDALATGHYASIVTKENKKYLSTTRAGKKDQSYFLYRLKEEQLSKLIFPLAPYTKEEIRAIALENKLPSASKGDSQDICFISGDYRDFLLENNISGMPGDMIFNGISIAKHTGLPHYTVGQRKLGIAWAHPLYVKEIDVNNNCLYLSDNDGLFSSECKLRNAFFAYEMNHAFHCLCKPRSAAQSVKCTVYPEGETAKVLFDMPFKALTPGQAAVFYSEEGLVLGGGVITRN